MDKHLLLANAAVDYLKRALNRVDDNKTARNEAIHVDSFIPVKKGRTSKLIIDRIIEHPDFILLQEQYARYDFNLKSFLIEQHF